MFMELHSLKYFVTINCREPQWGLPFPRRRNLDHTLCPRSITMLGVTAFFGRAKHGVASDAADLNCTHRSNGHLTTVDKLNKWRHCVLSNATRHLYNHVLYLRSWFCLQSPHCGTFGSRTLQRYVWLLSSQYRLSSVRNICRLSVTLAHSTHGVEFFRSILAPYCSLGIWLNCEKQRKNIRNRHWPRGF